ncbi:hypothetical protein AB3N59_05215 [Leptospira sp. WS92.C1]
MLAHDEVVKRAPVTATRKEWRLSSASGLQRGSEIAGEQEYSRTIRGTLRVTFDKSEGWFLVFPGMFFESKAPDWDKKIKKKDRAKCSEKKEAPL